MKRKSQKKEQKTFMGMPMNWDGPIFKNTWNPKDDRLFPPKSFGIGWTINLHAVLRRAGLIKKKKSK